MTCKVTDKVTNNITHQVTANPSTSVTFTTAAQTTLRGVGVLVTRPLREAQQLGARIEECGGAPIVFPVIEIQPPSNPPEVRGALRALNRRQVALLIFTSVHAVKHIGAQLRAAQLTLPAHSRIAAVGPQTARQCTREFQRVDFVAEQSIDSEGLLAALHSFDCAEQHIVIFRAQTGREHLKQTLESRGAQVQYVESYRRVHATAAVAPLIAKWRARKIDVVVATGVFAIDALMQLLGEHSALLLNTPICTYSARIADHCRQFGARGEIIIAQPGDRAVVDALIAWQKTRAAVVS